MAEASIVFRNEDMRSTPKIYVDYMDAAARLAAKYRNASYYVDVINRRDEVAYRWEDGKPAWGADIEGITAQVETYQFERPDDLFWDANNRVFLLTEALQYSLDIVRGTENQLALDALYIHEEVTNDAVWDLIFEAENFAKLQIELPNNIGRAQRFEKWGQDSELLFIGYKTEHVALSVKKRLSLFSV